MDYVCRNVRLNIYKVYVMLIFVKSLIDWLIYARFVVFSVRSIYD